MSSAPNTSPRQSHADYDDEAECEAAQATEDFLASFMHASNPDDGYSAPPYESVHIDAHMMQGNEDLLLLSDQKSSTAVPAAVRKHSTTHPDKEQTSHNMARATDKWAAALAAQP
jgi:hypothetical protein